MKVSILIITSTIVISWTLVAYSRIKATQSSYIGVDYPLSIHWLFTHSTTLSKESSKESEAKNTKNSKYKSHKT